MENYKQNEIIKVCGFGDFEFYIKNNGRSKLEINKIKEKTIQDLVGVYNVKKSQLNKAVIENPKKFEKYIGKY